MPLYEYQCVKCGRRTEKIEPVSGPHLKKCPHCGGKVESLLSAPAIQFKGSGWYVTDYAGKKTTSEASKSDSAAESAKSSGDAKDTGKDSAAKSAKDSSEKKAAKKR